MNAPQLPPELRPEVHKFEFTGSGSEYFKIWIVNILLTIITLGIYSAWAKVRRLKYFYQSTQLAGSGFEYHGSPTAILKGRAIAFGALAILHVAQEVNMKAYAAVAIVIAALMPWLLRRSFQFRLSNTSYRGLRFGFDGTTQDAYRVFILWPLAALATLTLLWPWAHQRIKAYQHGKSRFGAAAFRFKATGKDFMSLYVKISLISLIPIAVFAGALALVIGNYVPRLGDGGAVPMVFVMIGLAALALIPLIMLAIGPLFRAWTHNLVWNTTRLGPHRFRATASARSLTWIVLSNLVLTILTLGLYRPFAQIRVARYMVENMKFACFGGLDQFVAGTQKEVAAAGEEFAEALDLDIGI